VPPSPPFLPAITPETDLAAGRHYRYLPLLPTTRRVAKHRGARPGGVRGKIAPRNQRFNAA
jgi:hypothetical protein